eukprot:5787402-Prymnesium_polylepis.1
MSADELPISAWPTEPTELRWAVDLGGWEPRTREWYWLLRLLPPLEQLAVHAYGSDHRTGLVSRLLQRQCVATALGAPGPPLPYGEVRIGRTKGNKPFDATPRGSSAPHNLNFNVSYSGQLVALASDPALLIGLHLSPPFTSPFETIREEYSGVMSPREWEAFEALPTAADRVMAFRKAWTAKQAFVKARGDGAAFPLATVEVHLQLQATPRAPQPRLASSHVAVAPAELQEAADADPPQPSGAASGASGSTGGGASGVASGSSSGNGGDDGLRLLAATEVRGRRCTSL